MTASIPKSQLTFSLPNLSYVDARLEEPNLTAPAPQQTATGIFAWLARQATNFAAWNRMHDQAAELFGMSDRELSDMGLSRGDIPRVFAPQHAKDLHEARSLLG